MQNWLKKYSFKMEKLKSFKIWKKIITTAFVLFPFIFVSAQDTNRVTKSAPNPLEYVSLAFQNNFDFKIEPNDGYKWAMNIMPVIPIQINSKWSFINRIYAPVISQTDIYKNSSQTGISDILLSSFLSLAGKKIVWGIGPSVNIPVGSPAQLTSKKWALGPSVIAAFVKGKITLAGLYVYLWSIAGDEMRPDFSFSYFQPVFIYNLKKGWGLGLTSEICNEFKSKTLNGSVILAGSKLLIINKLLINLTLGSKYYFGNFNRPIMGVRAVISLLFP